MWMSITVNFVIGETKNRPAFRPEISGKSQTKGL
jgi:hypothetical protein